MKVFKKKPKPSVRTGGRIFEIKAVDMLRVGLLWLVAKFIKLWWWTLRDVTTDENKARFAAGDRPNLSVFWHNHLFMVPYWGYLRTKRPIVAMMSAGTIGSWISRLYKHFGIEAARGSVNLRAKQGLKELVQAVEDGKDAVVTPDGSRGPMYSFKSGAAMLAKKTGCEVLLMSCKFHSAWRLKTWDRFYIPKPFSKVELIVLPYKDVSEITESEEIREITEVMRNKLLEITQDTHFEKKWVGGDSNPQPMA